MEDVSNVSFPMFLAYSWNCGEYWTHALVSRYYLHRTNSTCVIKYPSGDRASKSAKLIYNQAAGMIYILNISTRTESLLSVIAEIIGGRVVIQIDGFQIYAFENDITRVKFFKSRSTHVNLNFPFDLRNRLFETVVDSGYPVARSWEKRGTKVSRWIWNSHFVSSLFPSLCTPNPTQSFPFNPNVSTFSSRGRIQRDWNHDSLALPFYLLMPSSEWRPSGTIVIPSSAREVRSPPLLVNANSIGDSRRGIMARSPRHFRGKQAILGGKGNTLLR